LKQEDLWEKESMGYPYNGGPNMVKVFKGAVKNELEETVVQQEMASYLQLDNINFLIGAGCSSHIVDGTELGIPGMRKLYDDFFKENADFSAAGLKLKDRFDSNLEKMLEALGAIQVANEIVAIDKDIDEKIDTVRKFIRSKIIEGLHGKEVLSIYKDFYKRMISESRKAPINIFTTNYDLAEFAQAIEFATLYEGSVSSQRIQEYTATLITRLQTIKDGIQGKILSKTQYNSLDEYVAHFVGNWQIIDVDISSLDDASAEVVTKVLAKMLLDYVKHKEHKADMPINFIIEEAHRFVKEDSYYGAVGYNIFERIAKEGRKYGFLLGISSQRPSELSKTVVSQCGNFIIHRVQNPDDLKYISRMVPYINSNMIERLTYLQTGNALVFGTAINIPTLTRFDQARPATDSENAKITEKWYIE
jgi:hypothetical protein